jgi:hypothetical protein
MFAQNDKEGMEYIDHLIRESIKEHNSKVFEDCVFNPNAKPVWA